MTANSAETIRILLVEDDEEDYIIARHLLSNVPGQTFDLVWAHNLAEGIQTADSGFDAILLDLSLPDSHGIETFSRMNRKVAHTPIILLTGGADEGMGIRAVMEGAQDYLAKSEISSALLARSIRYAIERGRLERDRERIAKELRARNTRMLQELQMAHDVQNAFLGRQFPVFPPSARPENSALRFAHLYRPTRIVGGDFFSVLPVSETTAGILICDVMGHGVCSALVTAIIRGLIEDTRAAAADPSRFLAALNNGLTGVLGNPEELMFVSAFYATIDAVTGAVAWANAGHPHPLHLRSETHDVHELRGGEDVGPAMGILRDAVYESLSTTLAPGDRILLFTDGIFELPCPDGTDYGQTRLQQTVLANLGLPLDSMLTAVLKDVETAAHNSEPNDDICVLGVEWAHPVREEASDELPP